MLISEPTQIDVGISARPTATGFVSVDLAYQADPIAFTPEVIATERAGLPGWRWEKEYERAWNAQAGQPVFETEWIEMQRPRIEEPLMRARWDPEAKGLGAKPVSEGHPAIVADDHGPIRIYRLPSQKPDVMPAGIVGLRRACGIGIDVGEGVGQSDSTVQVFFADNNEQAAEYASNTVRPADLGRIAAALARFYNDALICCVRKMHGITVLRTIMDECRYPFMWRSKPTDRMMEMDAKSYGWPGGEATSPYLFGKWTDAMQYDVVQLHSLTTLDQHRQYIYDSSGRITHQARADLNVQVRERHGDLVVACALAYRACLDMPKYRRQWRRRMVPGSFEWRAEQQRAKKQEGEWD